VIGAIAGDIIGSVYEGRPVKTKDFELFSPHARFTDDTVLTVALAEAILTKTGYPELMRAYYLRHPRAGYGGMFRAWARSPFAGPYHSFGNGSAMRTVPVGYAFDTLDEVMEKARLYSACTHDHPEGVKGAQAVASAVFLARTGSPKEHIRSFLEKTFGYDLARSLDGIRPSYRFDPTCQGSVPEAIIAFLESDGYEDAVRNAVSLGGDSDTQACIAGGLAEAFHRGIPERIAREALARLTADLLGVTMQFIEKVMVPRGFPAYPAP